MRKVKKSFRERALAKAKQSMSVYKISAIAVSRNGNVLASAVNRPRFEREGGGIHAEMMALRKAGNGVYAIILCRIGGSGDLLPIHPCKRCQKVLDKKGIRVWTLLNCQR